MKIAKTSVIALLIIVIIASMLPMGALASGNGLAYGAATVDTQNLRLRSGPGLNHSVITLLAEGDIVVILERTNSEWYKVNFHGNVGFVSVSFLRDILLAENFNALGRITGSRVNLRARPNTSSDILTSYTENTELTIIGINNGWYKIQNAGLTGYIRSDFMEIISGQRAAVAANRTAADTPASDTASESSSVPAAPPANVELGQQIADFALQFLGVRYLWGGMSPSGFDCSGLVTYTYNNFGVSVTRNASGQWRDNGARVTKSDLAPGDLVFFSSNGRSVTHVGIYIGGDEFVHASRTGIGVVISRLDSSYYIRTWFGAKRLV